MAINPYLLLDPYLIWFFRLTSQAWSGFLLGNLAVACLALLLGEVTSFLAALLVRRHFEQVAGEARKYQNLSLEALQAGDRSAYEAANELANDAFNKSFFMQVALSATFFWPICFALGWLQSRFYGLEFSIPFTGLSLGYIGIFILLYLPVYILFKQIKRSLPNFRRIKAARTPARSLQPEGYRRSRGDLLSPSVKIVTETSGKPDG